jgi:hypothetical protein
VEPQDEQKQVEQAAWLVVVMLVVMFVLFLIGVADKLIFDGELFGGR